MEIVQEELKRWGEIMVTTDAGERYELHLGDTMFDYDKRLIRLKGPDAEYTLDGDSVAAIEMHYGHKIVSE